MYGHLADLDRLLTQLYALKRLAWQRADWVSYHSIQRRINARWNVLFGWSSDA